ncbi:hypothetical protein [Mucilaginibacter terrae]|uniref:Polysaccharide biosynthesis protein C-terminal domain-containing protein n=1 Tax=Mucilaginibacter terrae TaxID=1955052 RepID=A0ABU3GUH4_9SPHI|nr:hypothetical protein [Mucilaginibacter terrae]MDT3403419.1 hypothetical protein [Mucilaginibacter terrae]
MANHQISLPELFMLIAYLSFPVWCVARALQWMLLKPITTTARRVVILVVSLIISFIITIVIWGGWPGNPIIIGIISMPALCAEGFILLMTYLIKKNISKK